MFRLGGVEQHYAWGTKDVIPALLGREPDGTPVAECWFGAHPHGDSPAEGHGTLSAFIAENQHLLGAAAVDSFGGRLPYLVKFLSAGTPLSLQAHPSRIQAEQG